MGWRRGGFRFLLDQGLDEGAISGVVLFADRRESSHGQLACEGSALQGTTPCLGTPNLRCSAEWEFPRLLFPAQPYLRAPMYCCE